MKQFRNKREADRIDVEAIPRTPGRAAVDYLDEPVEVTIRTTRSTVPFIAAILGAVAEASQADGPERLMRAMHIVDMPPSGARLVDSIASAMMDAVNARAVREQMILAVEEGETSRVTLDEDIALVDARVEPAGDIPEFRGATDGDDPSMFA